MSLAAEMASAAGSWLASLSADQREHAQYPGPGRDDTERTRGSTRLPIMAALDDLHSAYAGERASRGPVCYRLQDRRLLVEYDNTQYGANHAHSVVRDLPADFGFDALAGHWRDFHADGPPAGGLPADVRAAFWPASGPGSRAAGTRRANGHVRALYPAFSRDYRDSRLLSANVGISAFRMAPYLNLRRIFAVLRRHRADRKRRRRRRSGTPSPTCSPSARLAVKGRDQPGSCLVCAGCLSCDCGALCAFSRRAGGTGRRRSAAVADC